MQIAIEKMDISDLNLIDLNDFDDFWNYNILKDELSSNTSYYIIAKCENIITGFAGIKFLLDEAHITNIVVKKDMRHLRYWFKTFRKFNCQGKRNLYFNYIRSK